MKKFKKTKNIRLLNGFRYESLDAKIRYMLSLPLWKRYAQGCEFADFLLLARRDKGYVDVRKTFGTVQVVRKK